MAPSLLYLFIRTTLQWNIARPRVLNPTRTVRMWFIIILLFNSFGFWTHATTGVPTGRSVVLDFIAMGALHHSRV